MTPLTIILGIVFFVIGFFFVLSMKRIIKIISNYKKLGKEKFWNKFKEGAEAITPLQLSKANLRGQWMVLFGTLIGCVVTPIVKIKGVWWWVEIILVGSFFLTIVGLLGTWQKYQVLKKQDEIMKQLNIEYDHENKDY